MTSESITRRTILKAGVWSVPVIAVAAAAPAVAASTNTYLVIFASSSTSTPPRADTDDASYVELVGWVQDSDGNPPTHTVTVELVIDPGSFNFRTGTTTGETVKRLGAVVSAGGSGFIVRVRSDVGAPVGSTGTVSGNGLWYDGEVRRTGPVSQHDLVISEP